MLAFNILQAFINETQENMGLSRKVILHSLLLKITNESNQNYFY